MRFVSVAIALASVHPLLAQAVEGALGPFDVAITRVPFTRPDIWAQVQPARRQP